VGDKPNDSMQVKTKGVGRAKNKNVGDTLDLGSSIQSIQQNAPFVNKVGDQKSQ